MALRKGKCYHTPERPYTRRSKVKSKNYVKGVPQTKVSKFIMGNLANFSQGKYPCTVTVCAKEPVQMRDNAIEASRMFVNRELDNELKGDYFFTVPAYPHQILREKKILMGAGADRMSSGMQLAFGKPCALAARLSAGDKIFRVACTKNAVPAVRKILERIKAKLPGRKIIAVEERK